MTSLGRARSAAERVNVMSGRVLGDATWDRVRPPAGFNCRCELRLEDAKRRDGQDTNANVEGLPDKYEIVDGSDTYERVALSVGRPARLTIVIVSRSHWIEREVTDEASCLDEFAVAIDEALECEPAGSHRAPVKAWITYLIFSVGWPPVMGWTWRPPQ